MGQDRIRNYRMRSCRLSSSPTACLPAVDKKLTKMYCQLANYYKIWLSEVKLNRWLLCLYLLTVKN